MFEMKEVVGVSAEGFSAAVRQAIEQLIQDGYGVHFFEVVEQRGAVRGGALKEFQVTVKAAVEAPKQDKPVGAAADSCATCGEHTGAGGHLCVPRPGDIHECEWCGAVIPDERHACDAKVKELSYICNTCGRLAVRPEYLCKPKPIAAAE